WEKGWSASRGWPPATTERGEHRREEPVILARVMDVRVERPPEEHFLHHEDRRDICAERHEEIAQRGGVERRSEGWAAPASSACDGDRRRQLLAALATITMRRMSRPRPMPTQPMMMPATAKPRPCSVPPDWSIW